MRTIVFIPQRAKRAEGASSTLTRSTTLTGPKTSTSNFENEKSWLEIRLTSDLFAAYKEAASLSMRSTIRNVETSLQNGTRASTAHVHEVLNNFIYIQQGSIYDEFSGTCLKDYLCKGSYTMFRSMYRCPGLVEYCRCWCDESLNYWIQADSPS